MTEVEEPCVTFCKRMLEHTATIRPLLTESEYKMFEHWLKVCRVDNATYELERACVRHPRRTAADVELPIDTALANWKVLVESVGGKAEAQILLIERMYFYHPH